eukprot:CAMPEP_0175087106 /NCGR_PEP_ID=MMETSP0052_2-20121109/29642_1 /TAXON_ID=51329 ORGANISM="Polytomella parva, Strain SAG 63-3" /NCGR_SAMPLE_ID=MMETSP0052_2 /ASSEMBLY_ACC=CAM_ASM_000194 /LENGTH=149 /DNA_ID=CAMNT_0016359407 /DNA_START=996 /DNA_END=1445 /DNA_ORIENTATION=+
MVSSRQSCSESSSKRDGHGACGPSSSNSSNSYSSSSIYVDSHSKTTATATAAARGDNGTADGVSGQRQMEWGVEIAVKPTATDPCFHYTSSWGMPHMRGLIIRCHHHYHLIHSITITITITITIIIIIDVKGVVIDAVIAPNFSPNHVG